MFRILEQKCKTYFRPLKTYMQNPSGLCTPRQDLPCVLRYFAILSVSFFALLGTQMSKSFGFMHPKTRPTLCFTVLCRTGFGVFWNGAKMIFFDDFGPIHLFSQSLCTAGEAPVQIRPQP